MDAVARAFASGHISGDGPATKRCQLLLERELGVPKVLMTTSCTHALELAALLLDFEAGDEVIVPSFTFVSTVNAFALRGATPVIADIRADTLNLDERLVEQLVTPRTKAIVAVHYAGVGCELERLIESSRRQGVALVEDNAHGLFGRYRGGLLGTFGVFATQSFHETKNFTCGEGGALVINDEAFVERAEIIREKGTDRSRFFRGQVDKYTWVDLGSSYVASDLLAAVLESQLLDRERIQAARRRVWDRYARDLADWAVANDTRLPTVPEHCEHPAHLFHLLLPDRASRSALIEHLADRGILAVFHYLPLNRSAMGKRLAPRNPPCPVAEDVADRVLRLPLYNDMTEAELDLVVESVLAFSV
jgi:dTDP-4-amino-4,6-dideoxygalactose transaminase